VGVPVFRDLLPSSRRLDGDEEDQNDPRILFAINLPLRMPAENLVLGMS